MKVDVILSGDLARMPELAARAERAGADGVMVSEVAHDPFPPLTLAATATERLRLATGITVAFARSPMTVAVVASDIHRLSGGRLALGLGSQIKAHITRRFSMPWSRPADRMREYVSAVRAIWRAWEDGAALDFRGDFYQHTLMTPMFSPGPSPCGWPSIQIAGVGPRMTEVAGEVADGLITHGFTTPAYVRDVTTSHLSAGLARSGRRRQDVEVSVPAMLVVATGDDDPVLDGVRATIAFYGSTPAYRPVLEHHGWGALGDELNALSRRGEWAAMGGLVDDEVVSTFAAVGSPKEVAAALLDRYSAIADRIQLALHEDDDTMAELVDALR